MPRRPYRLPPAKRIAQSEDTSVGLSQRASIHFSYFDSDLAEANLTQIAASRNGQGRLKVEFNDGPGVLGPHNPRILLENLMHSMEGEVWDPCAAAGSAPMPSLVPGQVFLLRGQNLQRSRSDGAQFYLDTAFGQSALYARTDLGLQNNISFFTDRGIIVVGTLVNVSQFGIRPSALAITD